MVARRRSVTLLLLISVLAASPSAALAVGSPATPPAENPLSAALTPGSNAAVKADGDCLRIRQSPALNATSLTCLPEGAIVEILEGSVTADGYTWQKVRSGSIEGWAAEQYLEPAGATGGACPATAPVSRPVSARPTGLTGGELPVQGGFGLTVWHGGATEDIATTAAAGGCQLAAVWATSPEGAFVVYIFGAPEVVNQPWMTMFPDGQVPDGTAVLVVCAGPTTSALSAGSTQGAGSPALATGPESTLTSAPQTAATPTPTPTPSPTPTATPNPNATPTVAARAALVMDGNTGKTLFEKDARLALAPASLTKMVTAILAIEQGELDAWVKVDVDSRQMPGSSLMGLLPGDCFQLRDLIYGLMLPSGNDAALAIARHIAGSDAAFVDEMNAFVAALALTDTHFVNPHGLDAAGHLTSAHDLAAIARYGMSLPIFEAIVGTPQWSAKGSRTINLPNVNGFLSSYPGADGVKTGFTDAAGRTLVSSATRNGRRIFVILLNDDVRYEDAAKLTDWAFTKPG
ncbi:MAG: SH3 domain-containing protein [Dehalococcoidia bacterium]